MNFFAVQHSVGKVDGVEEWEDWSVFDDEMEAISVKEEYEEDYVGDKFRVIAIQGD